MRKKSRAISAVGYVIGSVTLLASIGLFDRYHKRYDALPAEVQRVLTIRESLSRAVPVARCIVPERHEVFCALAAEEARLVQIPAVADGVRDAVRYSRNIAYCTLGSFAAVSSLCLWGAYRGWR